MSFELRKRWEHAGGTIPDDWKIVPLETLLRDNKSIAVGVMYPGPETPGGIPLIKVGDISQGIVPVKPSYCISPETNAEYKRTQLQGDELLITLVGNPGECVVVAPHMAGWNPARAIAVLRLQDSSIRVYLKTLLESAAGKHLIDAVLNTTVQKTLNLKDIKQLPIPIPKEGTIKALSEFAEAISDRIGILRETNATLEAIAQALFKSWFVDFDPVHAKRQDLAPEGMDEATAALFPDSFEESELGLVPRGWRVSTLEECSSYLNRGISPKYTENDGIVVINQKCIRDFIVDLNKARRHDPNQRKVDGRELRVGDVLVNSTGVGTLGRVAQILTLEESAIVDSHVTVVRANEELSWNYLGLALMRKQPEIENFGEGTTGQTELSRGKLASIKLVVPSKPIIDQFDEITMAVRNRFARNLQQAQTLATLRDTLLPRLISGQLRLPEAEALIEETA